MDSFDTAISGTITLKSPRLERSFEERDKSFTDFTRSIQQYLDRLIGVINETVAGMLPVGFVAGQTSTFETKFVSSGVEISLKLSVMNSYHGDLVDASNFVDILSAIKLHVFTMIEDPFGDEERLVTQLIDQIIADKPDLPDSIKQDLAGRLRAFPLDDLRQYVDKPDTLIIRWIDDKTSQMVSDRGPANHLVFDDYMN